MIADYSAEIKIAIFQSVSECHGNEWRSSSNCGRIAAKIARFNSINSEITGRKLFKFWHDVAWLLPLNLFKADLRSANPCRMLKQRVVFFSLLVADRAIYYTFHNFFLFSFLMIARRKIISEFTGPIFAIFAPNDSICSYMADLDLFFDSSSDVAMATN